MSEDQSAVERFCDRVEYLIKTDEDLTVAETLGALLMVAFNVADAAFHPDNDDVKP